MSRYARMIMPILLALALLAGCNLPGPRAGDANAEQTLIAKSAQETVDAMSGGGIDTGPTSTPPLPTLGAVETLVPTEAATSTPGADGATPSPPAQSSEYWVTVVLKNKLYVNNGTTGAQITNTPGRDWGPAWSPDGKTLAFIRFDAASRGVLYALEAGSSEPRVLDGALFHDYFAWLPGTNTIVAGNNSMAGSAGEVNLINLSTGSTPALIKDTAEKPVPSPDGKKFAVLVFTGEPCSSKGCMSPNDVFVYDVAAQTATRLTGDAVPKTGLAWAPDSQQIAYRIYDDNSGKVDIVNLQGKLVGENQPAPWWVNGWVSSPYGGKIAYHVTNFNTGEKGVFVVENNAPRAVVMLDPATFGQGMIDTLRWRPDGTGLLFNIFTDLYSVNLDGSGLTKLNVPFDNVFFDVRPSTTPYTPPPTPAKPDSWPMCPGALATRLDVGMKAMVSSNPPTPNNVREGPYLGQKLVGQIQPGETITILDGPVCDQGTMWWNIQSDKSGIKGYTLEGDKTTYWLVPLK